MLLPQVIDSALALVRLNDGNSSAARMATMAITTSSSMSVKPPGLLRCAVDISVIFNPNSKRDKRQVNGLTAAGKFGEISLTPRLAIAQAFELLYRRSPDLLGVEAGARQNSHPARLGTPADWKVGDTAD